jgi:hypothetical protein
METIIGTWLHAETKDAESYYPQVGGAPSSSSFQSIYWRCVVLFYASSVRHNPEARHRLYTTVERIPNIGAFATGEFLERLGVEVVRVPFTYLPPPGYHGSWRNQFYILDIIKHLDQHGRDGEQFLVLDSDCIFTASARPIAAALSRHGLLTFDLNLGPDENINGITRRDMRRIYQELGLSTPGESVPYYGGEFFAADVQAVRRLAAEVDPLWEVCLSRFRESQPKFNEEAHFLSYLYTKLGYPCATANPFVARIWTGFKYRNASRDNFNTTIWHVPAEKKFGIKRLFRLAIQPDSAFWTVSPGPEFARLVAGFLGIPHSSLFKKSQDALDAVLWRVNSRRARKQVTA